MSSVYKNFGANDIVEGQGSRLHESIPLTGTMVSGTYGEANIKNYAHGLFQSTYDYYYLSSSANKIFDITSGYSANSAKSASANESNSDKIKMYSTMAAQLVGHDVTGSILEFDSDGDLTTTGDKMKECIFICYSRLLVKDGIKKGSFFLQFATGGVEGSPDGSSPLTLGDYGAQNEFRTNSPVGDYGILYTASAAVAGTGVGLVYYKTGIAVVTASVFDGEFGGRGKAYNTSSANDAFSSGTISDLADGVRNRWFDCDFNNEIELNSTMYYVRVNHNDFNYSSNPTYLSGSKIVTKNTAKDLPVSYVTGVGLYSPNNELLAVAKLSEPIKNTPETEFTLRVRTDW